MSNVFFITDDNDLLWLYGVVVKYNTAKVWKNFVSPNFFEKNFKESQFLSHEIIIAKWDSRGCYYYRRSDWRWVRAWVRGR